MFRLILPLCRYAHLPSTSSIRNGINVRMVIIISVTSYNTVAESFLMSSISISLFPPRNILSFRGIDLFSSGFTLNTACDLIILACFGIPCFRTGSYAYFLLLHFALCSSCRYYLIIHGCAYRILHPVTCEFPKGISTIARTFCSSHSISPYFHPSLRFYLRYPCVVAYYNGKVIMLLSCGGC